MSEVGVAYVGQGLRDRRGELTAAILSRVDSVSPHPSLVDDEYIRGLRLAVPEAIDYGIAVMECGGRPIPPVPPTLLIQARLAARHGISLESVLRRYIAGHALLTKFVIEEVARDSTASPDAVIKVMQTIGALLDLIVDAVSEEYMRESRTQVRTTEQRRVESIRRLLRGELLFTDQFAYDFNGGHVGILASGFEAAGSVRALARALDRKVLLVQPVETTVWAWLEIRGEFDWDGFERTASAELPPSVALSAGDFSRGIVGWRLTHEQARAAATLAHRRPGEAVRYGPNSLHIAALNDDRFRASLHENYLEPLSSSGRDDFSLQDTLRSYFAAGRNASSSAAALGVSRRTVTNRVQIAEKLIGSTLTACGAGLEVALWLEEMEREPPPQIGMPSGTDI